MEAVTARGSRTRSRVAHRKRPKQVALTKGVVEQLVKGDRRAVGFAQAKDKCVSTMCKTQEMDKRSSTTSNLRTSFRSVAQS